MILDCLHLSGIYTRPSCWYLFSV